jgi:hypothetical protein
VEAAPRIGVLEQVGAVEPAEAVGVGREVRGHPVDDHPDAGLVQRVDHRHQIVGRAVATGGREVAGDLVAPRAVERVGQDRHQLDVGEAQAAGVLGQPLAERAVAQRRAVIAVLAHPRAQVDLVDRPRRVEPVAGVAPRHPRGVLPRVGLRPDDRRGGRRRLGGGGERVGLVEHLAAARVDAELVAVAGRGVDGAALPQPRAAARRQPVAALPVVPVAEHLDALGVGGPQREPGAVGAGVRAQPLVQLVVRALVEQVQVVVGEAGQVGRAYYDAACRTRPRPTPPAPVSRPPPPPTCAAR